jgi:hypothetical protein
MMSLRSISTSPSAGETINSSALSIIVGSPTGADAKHAT